MVQEPDSELETYDAAEHARLLAELHLTRRSRRDLGALLVRAVEMLDIEDAFITLSDATWDDEPGLLVVTDDRLWFLGTHGDDLDLPRSQIQQASVQRTPHGGLAKLLVETRTEMVLLEDVGRVRWAREIAEAITGSDEGSGDDTIVRCPVCGHQLSRPLTGAERCPECGLVTANEGDVSLGLFRSKPEPPKQPRHTINGRPVAEAETLGGLQRRTRLMGEAARRLRANPLTQPSASGTPLGDGLGLEQLVALIRPIFNEDRALVRWVAMRGAVSFLYIQYLETEETRAAGWMSLLRAMGLDLREDPDGDLVPVAYEPPGSSRLTEEEIQGVIGLFGSLSMRMDDYPQFEGASAAEIVDSPWFRVSEAVAFDYIAWAMTAILRDEVAQNILALPEPSGFEGPGWYVDPLFAKSYRYWDNDWTSRCRSDHGSEEFDIPIA